jgi:enamine deaminase RidA (YjgF/YER057c/UK114 family)
MTVDSRLLATVLACVFIGSSACADGVKIIPYVDGGVKPTGSWSAGARAGDFVFVGGMRGIDPATNKLVDGEEARIRQMFVNMQQVAAAEGASLRDAVRLTIYVSDVVRLRPVVNKVQEDLWGKGPYPPRTVLEVRKLDQDDIAEVDGTFYAPLKK